MDPEQSRRRRQPEERLRRGREHFIRSGCCLRRKRHAQLNAHRASSTCVPLSLSLFLSLPLSLFLSRSPFLFLHLFRTQECLAARQNREPDGEVGALYVVIQFSANNRCSRPVRGFGAPTRRSESFPWKRQLFLDQQAKDGELPRQLRQGRQCLVSKVRATLTGGRRGIL